MVFAPAKNSSSHKWRQKAESVFSFIRLTLQLAKVGKIYRNVSKGSKARASLQFHERNVLVRNYT